VSRQWSMLLQAMYPMVLQMTKIKPVLILSTEQYTILCNKLLSPLHDDDTFTSTDEMISLYYEGKKLRFYEEQNPDKLVKGLTFGERLHNIMMHKDEFYMPLFQKIKHVALRILPVK